MPSRRDSIGPGLSVERMKSEAGPGRVRSRVVTAACMLALLAAVPPEGNFLQMSYGKIG